MLGYRRYCWSASRTRISIIMMLRGELAEEDVFRKSQDVDCVKMLRVVMVFSCWQVTLKSGIENMLMHYIPEVKEVVEAPPDEAESAGLSEFARLEAQLSN